MRVGFLASLKEGVCEETPVSGLLGFSAPKVKMLMPETDSCVLVAGECGKCWLVFLPAMMFRSRLSLLESPVCVGHFFRYEFKNMAGRLEQKTNVERTSLQEETLTNIFHTRRQPERMNPFRASASDLGAEKPKKTRHRCLFAKLPSFKLAKKPTRIASRAITQPYNGKVNIPIRLPHQVRARQAVAGISTRVNQSSRKEGGQWTCEEGTRNKRGGTGKIQILVRRGEESDV